VRFRYSVLDGTCIELSTTTLGRMRGVETIGFGMSLDTTKVKGLGRIATDTTPGIISMDDGSMTVWTGLLADWIRKSGGPLGFFTTRFDVTITYQNLGFPLNSVVLTGCRPINVRSDHDISAPDNLVSTVDFCVLDIIWNGTGIIGKAFSDAVNVVRDLGLPGT
jgi:hypothetical protein